MLTDLNCFFFFNRFPHPLFSSTRNLDTVAVPLNTNVSPAAELNRAFTLVSVHSSASLPSVGGSCVVVFLPEPCPVLSSSLSAASAPPFEPYSAYNFAHKKTIFLIICKLKRNVKVQ